MRDGLIARESVERMEKKWERDVMIGEECSCEKYLRLVGIEFHIRLEKLRKERSENFNLDIPDGREEH